jgi:hypothetical protein
VIHSFAIGDDLLRQGFANIEKGAPERLASAASVDTALTTRDQRDRVIR